MMYPSGHRLILFSIGVHFLGMKIMNIKVQVESASTSAILTSGFPKENDLLTYIAYSPEFKARILELAMSGRKMWLSQTDIKKDGEWFEERDPHAVLFDVS